MKLQAIEVNQNGKRIFIGKIPAETLIDASRCRADLWDSSNPSGYQRKNVPSREASFANYVMTSKRVFPVPVILSVRHNLSFKPGQDGVGVLSFPDNEIIYQVDGQHRIGGLRKLISIDGKFSDIDVPVVILPPGEWAEKPEKIVFEEALQFYTINKTQKGVRSDLAARFLGKIKDEGLVEELPKEITRAIEWLPKAIQVTELLNESEGIWQNKIIKPNGERKGKLVSEGAFSDSLRPIVTNESLNLQAAEAGQLAEYVARFWQALKNNSPEAFESPEDYVIQKTTGAYVLHSFLVSILAILSRNKVKKLTIEAFQEIISQIPELGSTFWHIKGYAGSVGTNRKSFKLLEEKLQERLKKIKATHKEVVPFEL